MPTITSNPTVHITPVIRYDRRIEGNVDPTTGPIDHSGSLFVGGDIVDLMRVRCGGSLHVGGVIQAADVQISGDLVAAGGISGRDKGRCFAGGNITAHYFQKAVVEAGGTITTTAEIRASQITCGGTFVNLNGRILGGSVMATGGIFCRNLGGPTGIPTLAAAGNGPALQELAMRATSEMEVYRAKARHAAELGNRLLRDQKRLSPQAKERATELLFKSYELEANIKKTMQMIQARHADAIRAANAEIQVSEAIHSGVIIRFSNMEASIVVALKGPLRIAPRASGTRCIVVTEVGGGTILLPTRTVSQDSQDVSSRRSA